MHATEKAYKVPLMLSMDRIEMVKLSLVKELSKVPAWIQNSSTIIQLVDSLDSRHCQQLAVFLRSFRTRKSLQLLYAPESRATDERTPSPGALRL